MADSTAMEVHHLLRQRDEREAAALTYSAGARLAEAKADYLCDPSDEHAEKLHAALIALRQAQSAHAWAVGEVTEAALLISIGRDRWPGGSDGA
jgi:hypothetical protein